MLALLLALAASDAAAAKTPQIRVGVVSEQLSGTHAAATATISSSHTTTPATPPPAKPPTAKTPAAKTPPLPPPRQAAPSPPTLAPAPLPTLPSDSPLLEQAHPFGPTSFWYQQNGDVCVYLADASPNCYALIPSHTAPPAPPPPNPATLAAATAARILLDAGTIAASPSPRAMGLTGAASWFWLTPTPTNHSATARLNGEQVDVEAEPVSVRWSFGDGTSEHGGAGTPYANSPASAAAITHSYRTRCLPGDRGHTAPVLASCQGDGYTVQATISWSFRYQATGPIRSNGTLPERTTRAQLAYPVSEARAFLAPTP